MCNCPSCTATDNATQWPSEIDEVRLAKYARAVETGKVPSDPVYAAHVRFGRFVPNLEFSESELRDRSQRMYRVPAARPAYLAIPNYKHVSSTAQYIREFNKINNLKD